MDEFYFEESPQYNALFSYLEQQMFRKNKAKAVDVAMDVHDSIQMGANLQVLFNQMTMQGVAMKDKKQVNEVTQLVMELNNHVRLWENNGLTPHELSSGTRRQNQSSLGREFLEVVAGRNDPCPCGSGKKYKKCCMK